jgi:hypothetical protein
MPEIPTEVSGQLIRDLCEKLGLDHNEVYRIEIQPSGLVITHTFRRNESGHMVIGIDEPLSQVTHIKIRWSS